MTRFYKKVYSVGLAFLLPALFSPMATRAQEPLRYGESFDALLLPKPSSQAEAGGGRVPVASGVWAGGSRIGTPQVVSRQGGTAVVIRFDISNSHGSKPHINIQQSDGSNEHIEVSPGARVTVGIRNGKITVKVNGRTVRQIRVKSDTQTGNDELEITRSPDGTVRISKGGKKVAEIKEGDGVTVETEKGKTHIPSQKGGQGRGKGRKKDDKKDDGKQNGKKDTTGVKSMTLSQAMQQGLVACEMEGTGSPHSAKLQIRKLTDTPLVVIVPPGMVLQPGNGAYQSLVVR